MCDYFDDFEDDYDGFMEDDALEDSCENDVEMDELYTDDSEFEDTTDPAGSKDREFNVTDAFIVGGAMGFVYKDGLEEGKRKKRKRKRLSDDDYV